jgi:hypothetical protein
VLALLNPLVEHKTVTQATLPQGHSEDMHVGLFGSLQ